MKKNWGDLLNSVIMATTVRFQFSARPITERHLLLVYAYPIHSFIIYYSYDILISNEND